MNQTAQEILIDIERLQRQRALLKIKKVILEEQLNNIELRLFALRENKLHYPNKASPFFAFFRCLKKDTNEVLYEN